MAIVINGSGTVTGLAVGGLPDGTVDSGTLATNSVDSAELIDGAVDSSHFASGVGGKVLQVVQFVFTDTVATTAVDNTFVDTPLTVNITPSATSSKVLVMVYLGKVGVNQANRSTNFRLVRGSTDLSVGNASSSRTRASFYTAIGADTNEAHTLSMNYLDSPSSTSTLTYKLKWSGHNGDTHSLNYGGANSDSADAPQSRTASSIIVMEIGA